MAPELGFGVPREPDGAGRLSQRNRYRNSVFLLRRYRQVRPYFKQILGAPCLAALAVTVSMSARADIWGYVDETGTARISSTKLDARYHLFFKGGTTVEAPDAAAVANTQLRAAFERTPVLQRAVDHRNAGLFEPLIEQYAKLQQLDPALVKAVIAVESSFEPDAVSAKGAVGLMQIVPETAERYGVAGDATRSVGKNCAIPQSICAWVPATCMTC